MRVAPTDTYVERRIDTRLWVCWSPCALCIVSHACCGVGGAACGTIALARFILNDPLNDVSYRRVGLEEQRGELVSKFRRATLRRLQDLVRGCGRERPSLVATFFASPRVYECLRVWTSAQVYGWT